MDLSILIANSYQKAIDLIPRTESEKKNPEVLVRGALACVHQCVCAPVRRCGEALQWCGRGLQVGCMP